MSKRPFQRVLERARFEVDHPVLTVIKVVGVFLAVAILYLALVALVIFAIVKFIQWIIGA